MKPMIIISSDLMDKENIEVLRSNDICVVVSSDPSKVRFVDPIPSMSSRTSIENAAIALSRKVLNGQVFDASYNRDFAKAYVEILIKGTPLDPHPSQEELHKKEYDSTKLDEIRRIAREDARAEAKAKKESKTTTKQ